MIVKTEAIILRSMKYGETSRILTLYTRDFGRMSVIVKGARGEKNKFGASLDLMSRSAVVMYRKEHRELQLMTQADLLRQYRGIIDAPDRLMYGFAILEFLSATVHGEEAHEELYDILLQALEALDAERVRPVNVLLHYLLRLSEALGIGVDTQHCMRCRASFDHEDTLRGGTSFSLSDGGFPCTDCAPAADSLVCAVETLRALSWLDRHEAARVHTLALSSHASQEGLNLLHRHIVTHVPDMRAIRSLPMLDIFS
ncbi:MAG: DNA repair protein RecO [Bacteroidetes bacterium]|nr:DNA repair protein RecO [Bacteroidota bacterium]